MFEGLSQLLGNPWLYILGAVWVIARNVFGAFPEPDPNITSGFGSRSPGYRFVYQMARGITGDLSAIGVNLKGVVAAKLPTTTSTGTGTAINTQNKE